MWALINQWHDIINTSGFAHTLSGWSRKQWNCSVDSICGSMGKQLTQWGTDKNVSVTSVSPGWWYWAAVNYRVLLQLPKRSQLSFSASLSAKLAVLQLFMDAHGLFLPADSSRTVWKWDCVAHWSFGFEFRRADRILSVHRLASLCVGDKALHKCWRCSHMQIKPLHYETETIPVLCSWNNVSLKKPTVEGQLYIRASFGEVF